MIHHQHFVGVDDGVQPMGDDDDGARRELLIDGVLDQGIRVRVNGCRCFIEADDLNSPQHQEGSLIIVRFANLQR